MSETTGSVGTERPNREDVGVILVHGIGEQRRFEHLDGQLRYLIRALRALQHAGAISQVSVDIVGSAAAPFHADQDTWNAGPEPSVTVVVHHSLDGAPRETRLQVHEVWWADVNEPYSLAKQFRFWLWGLAVWAHPGKQRSKLGTFHLVDPPKVSRSLLWDRARLFLVGAFFVLVGYSIGTLTFLAGRLLNLRTPDVLQVLANYISSVKLYSQRRRFGPGLLWEKQEFIDAVDEPPRVSVRRRMIRAIADVAANDYRRWYILAHSQGSVVAFNGLMETGYAWPGYLDEKRWQRLCAAGLAGPGGPAMAIPTDRIMPRRPVWAQPDDIVYRAGIFDKFRGFLTYGSPLEKFAGLWPALVPITREPAFKPGVPWLNIYDPIDPVAGRLLAFKAQAAECCPPAEDLGYAASWVLLLAHLKYLTHHSGAPTDLARTTVKWLLTDQTSHFRSPPAAIGARVGTWFAPLASGLAGSTRQERIRRNVAWATWIGAAVALLLLGAIILPMLLDAATAAIVTISRAALRLGPSFLHPIGHWLAQELRALRDLLLPWVSGYWCRMLALAVGAVVLTGIAGGVARFGLFRRDLDDPDR